MATIAAASAPDPDESAVECLLCNCLREHPERKHTVVHEALAASSAASTGSMRYMDAMGSGKTLAAGRQALEALGVSLRDLRDLRVSEPGPPPPLLEDVDGYDLKPDPSACATMEELFAGLRAFWEWAGAPSSRKLASRAQGAFSHTTVNNLLSEVPWRRPPLTLEYIQGLIRACGGDVEEVRRWTTAWRRICLAQAHASGEADVISLPSRTAAG
jgi:hypothetical protein